MEFVFTLVILLMASSAVLLIVALVSLAAKCAGKSFAEFFRRGLWFLALPPLMFLYGSFVERDRTVVKEVEISSGKLPEEFDGYRIVQISDLHLRSFRNRADILKKAVGRINSLEPDAVMFTGDLVSYSPEELDSTCASILGGIEARDGVFSVLGNHDYCIYNMEVGDDERQMLVQELLDREEKMGWKVLMNSNVMIQCEPGDSVPAICVAGIENSSASVHFPSHGDLDKALDGADGHFVILLSHDPSYWEEILRRYPDVSLVLSGHTHSMQMSILGLSPGRILYKHYRGLHSSSDRHLYVNVGLGETAIMSRVGVPPEITLITLVSE